MKSFYKNLVLCGDVGYYCFLCSETFHKDEEVEKHIRWEKHRSALKTLEPLDKFSDDFIVKIPSKNTYYCEACNKLIPSMKTIKEHIGDEKHQLNKASFKSNTSQILNKSVIKMGPFGEIMFNELIITDRSWNGAVENHCYVCNDDFIHFDLHKKEVHHVINLIMTDTQRWRENGLFRQVDNRTFYCLTCNNVYPQNSFSTHWALIEHKEFYRRCQKIKENRNISEVVANVAKTSEKDINKELNLRDYIFDHRLDGKAECLLCDWCLPKEDLQSHINSDHHKTIAKMQAKADKEKTLQIGKVLNELKTNGNSVKENTNKEMISMINGTTHEKYNFKKSNGHSGNVTDFENKFLSKSNASSDDVDDSQKVKCSKDIDDKQYPVGDKEEYIDNHDSWMLIDQGKKRHELAVFGKDHFIKLNNPQKGWCWCYLCHVKISAHIKCLKSHAGGIRHAENLKLKKKGREPFTKEYLKLRPYKTEPFKKFVKHLDFRGDMCLINKSLQVPKVNLEMCQIIHKNRVFCFACDLLFAEDCMLQHCKSEAHEKNMANTRIFLNVQEFIREICPGLYHCGICNEIYPTHQLLTKHLASMNHGMARINIMEGMSDVSDDSDCQVDLQDLLTMLVHERLRK